MKILTLSFLIAIGVGFSALGKSLPKKAETENQIIVVKGYAYNDDELTFFVENKQWNSIEDFSNEPVYTASTLNGEGAELESINFNVSSVSPRG